MAASLALSLVALLAPASVDVEAGARQETRGGRVPLPVVEGEGSSAFRVAARSVLDLELVPFARIVVNSRRQRIEVGYAPRLLRRYLLTERRFLDQTLLFHQLEVLHSYRITRRLSWDAIIEAGRGAVDYASVATVLDPENTPLLGVTGVVDFNRVNAVGGFTWSWSRAQSSTLRADTRFVGPLGDTGPIPFPQLLEVGAEGVHTMALDRKNDVSSTIRGRWFSFDERVVEPRTFRLLSGRVSWAHQTRRLETRVSAGAVVIMEDTTRAHPLALVEADYRALHRRSIRLTLGASLALDIRPNQVFSTVDPQVIATVRARFEMNERLAIEPRAQFFTATTADPRPEEEIVDRDRAGIFAATIVSASLPVTYRVTDVFELLAGVRVSLRGPHLDAVDLDGARYGLGQEEIVGYAGLRMALGTRL